MSTRVFCQVPSSYLGDLAERFPEVEFVEVPLRGPAPEVTADVLYTWSRGTENVAEVLERGVRWIHTLGTGVDEFPLDLVGDRVLTCARGAAAIPISEWVLASMLAFEKQIPERWADEAPDEWLWASLGTLHGRRLALFGFGSIGERIARLALAFGMNVSAMRRTPTPSSLANVEIVSTLPALLTDADHVVVAAPLTPATEHVFDAAAFDSMKDGAHLVNIARGGLIDQDALRTALDQGRLARASLDATSPEPLPAGHWMYSHPRVKVTPHISWSWPNAQEQTTSAFADNLERWLNGDPLERVVDVDERY